MKAPIVYMEKVAILYLPQEEVNAMIAQEDKDTKREWAIKGALRGAGTGALGGGAFGALVGGMAGKGTASGFVRGAGAGAALGALAHAAVGAQKGYSDAKRVFAPSPEMLWQKQHERDVAQRAPQWKSEIEQYGGVVIGKGMASDKSLAQQFPKDQYHIQKDPNGEITIVSMDWTNQQKDK